MTAFVQGRGAAASNAEERTHEERLVINVNVAASNHATELLEQAACRRLLHLLTRGHLGRRERILLLDGAALRCSTRVIRSIKSHGQQVASRG